MSGKIYLIQNDDTLLEMTEKPYDTEDILQTLLEKYPDLLAGEQMDPGEARRWLLVSREVGVPGEQDGPNRWSLDHLFLDQDGIPTLVEVKRSSDSRIRREVVGQLLDYAANGVVYWPIDVIRAKFEATCETQGEDPYEIVQFLINPAGEAELDIDQFWNKVKTNLQAGKVRLVFVADLIPQELKRIVEFLNEQMDPAEILAVEIKQYVGQGQKTLVPRVIGQTAEAQQRKSSGGSRSKNQWDEASFLIEFQAQNGPEATSVVREILKWAEVKTNQVWWGKGTTKGTFVPTLIHKNTNHQLFAVSTNGSVEFYFQHFQYKEPFDSLEMRYALRERLNQIPDVNLPEDVITRRPSIDASILANGQNLQHFFEVFDWVIDEIIRS